MTFKLNKSLMLISLAIASTLPAMSANAGATISFGEDKSITAGFGFITSYSSVEKAAADGGRSNDFALNSARLYLSGSFNKYIKGMLNTERDIAGSGSNDLVQVIDANVQFYITPEIAIWAGRFLSPSDRANMAGPYYSMGGGYWAGTASRYGFNGGRIGRDEGVALVTSFMEDHLAISFGAFEGDKIFQLSGVGAQSSTSPVAKTLSVDDSLMYAGRVQYAFWDAEPGYYGTGNYFGGADILTVGIAGRTKSDGSIRDTTSPTSLAKKGDYTSYSVDFLLEKKDFGPGTPSIEAAYYDYDTDDVFLGEQGQAYSIAGAYLFSTPVGWGKFMPFARYQNFDSDAATANETRTWEIGTNYVMAPYNAVITAGYSDTKVTGSSSTNAFKIALQMQF